VSPETEMGGPAADFPATRWTLVAAARAAPERRRRALEELLARYWKPLYFLARRKGRSIESAKDDVQGFLLRLLDLDFPGGLDPSKGSLRGFLKIAFQNYLASGFEAAAALKRGGGRSPVPLDFELAERQASTSPASPDAAFEREWAVGVLERATERLRLEFEAGDRKGPFDVVRRYFAFGEAPPLADVAKSSGMSVPQVKAFLHRARVRFRELVREEVVDTAGDPDTEIGRLLEALKS
jgi:DNA-directed RNA polymerase specialized sigma24 family protein